MVDLSLVVALLSSAPAAISADAMRAVTKAVRDSGERDPLASVEPVPGVAPQPVTAETTYIANTRPRRTGNFCLSHRYAVVVPAMNDGAGRLPVHPFAAISFDKGCATADPRGFAQVQPAELPAGRTSAAADRLSALWSAAAGTGRPSFRCVGIATGMACPASLSALAAMAPLSTLKLLSLSDTGMTATFASAAGMVTEVTVPAQTQAAAITITQRQPPPL